MCRGEKRLAFKEECGEFGIMVRDDRCGSLARDCDEGNLFHLEVGEVAQAEMMQRNAFITLPPKYIYDRFGLCLPQGSSYFEIWEQCTFKLAASPTPQSSILWIG